MEFINKVLKKSNWLENQAAVYEEISSSGLTLITIDDNQTIFLSDINQKFSRQLNAYKEQEQLILRRIINTTDSKTEQKQWCDLSRKILQDQKKSNEELKRYENSINNIHAFNDQCQAEIEKEAIALKEINQGQFKSDFDSRPIRKFEKIENRLNISKGVYIDHKQNKIKVRIDTNNPNLNFGHNQLLEYELVFSKEHNKFLPAGNYPKDIIKIISHYNFHKNLGKLEKELQELCHLCHYT